MPAIRTAADIVHQFIEQDKRGSPFGQKRADNVAGRCDVFFIVLVDDRKSGSAAQLISDLASRRHSFGRVVITPASPDGVELGTHEDCRGGL